MPGDWDTAGATTFFATAYRTQAHRCPATPPHCCLTHLMSRPRSQILWRASKLDSPLAGASSELQAVPPNPRYVAWVPFRAGRIPNPPPPPGSGGTPTDADEF